MATTYTLISSQTLASSATSVTFSTIPSTYTDLCLKFSTRSSTSANTNGLTLTVNSSTSSYSETHLYGNPYADPTPFSGRNNLAPSAELLGYSPGSLATANTFGNGEIYIPNYAGSTNKVYGSNSVTENNSQQSVVWVEAGLWSNTSAITSITIGDYGGGNLVSGSTFYLYGIKNS